MGLFNFFNYFVKSFIRIFTRKFFYLILIFIFLACICFNISFVNASNYSNYIDITSYSDSQRTKLYEAIQNFNSYFNTNFDFTNMSNGYNYLINFWNSSSPDTTEGVSIYVFRNFTISSNYNGSFSPTNSYNNEFYMYEVYLSDLSIGYVDHFVNTYFTLGSNYFNQKVVFSSIDTSYFPKVIYDNFHIITPKILNSVEQLTTFDFDFFTINGGSTPYYTEMSEDIGGNADFNLIYFYNGLNINIPIDKKFIVVNENKWRIDIPYNVISSYVVIRDSKDFRFIFTYKPFYGSQYTLTTDLLTYNLTPEQVEDINKDGDKQLQTDILNSQNETNNKLDNLNGSIGNLNDNLTNSDIDDSNINEIGGLSNGLDVNDNTGIDQIFQLVYNAFCSNNVENISLTIPFVNKTFEISPNNISNKFPDTIKNIVGIFVWGVVGLWVLKDIRTITNKIAEGNPEQVGCDVKKEVL